MKLVAMAVSVALAGCVGAAPEPGDDGAAVDGGGVAADAANGDTADGHRHVEVGGCDVSDFVGRYILGNAAQMKPAVANYDRRSLMYGRVDLDPRPAGEGYTGYTSWRTPLAWQPGQTYRVEVTLNAVTRRQRLEVTGPNGASTVAAGDIDYFEPSLSAATYTLELGGQDSDGREVRAVGWQFCDLQVEASGG